MTIRFLTLSTTMRKIFRREDWEGNQEFSVCLMWDMFFSPLPGLLFTAHLLPFLPFHLSSIFHLLAIIYVH